jgi:hypothetical protein
VDWGQEYDRLLNEEHERASFRRFRLGMIGSGFGLAIGIYGYYFDHRGLLAKGVYSATQTASIIAMGDSIANYLEQSPYVNFDRILREAHATGSFDADRAKQLIALQAARQHRVGLYQKGYTSPVIATLYSFNGYREASANPTLSRVYYFVAANSLVFSAGAFLEIYRQRDLGPVLEFNPDPTMPVSLSLRF